MEVLPTGKAEYKDKIGNIIVLLVQLFDLLVQLFDLYAFGICIYSQKL